MFFMFMFFPAKNARGWRNSIPLWYETDFETILIVLSKNHFQRRNNTVVVVHVYHVNF